jgi:hypothetical protein
MPSRSTGGAAIKAKIKTMAATSPVGINKTPNQPIYKRFSVLVIQLQNFDHRLLSVDRSTEEIVMV